MQSSISNPLRLGLRQERVIPPQCLIIFGASGDLTHRKLIPALFELFLQRRIPSEFAIIGCARRPWSDQEFKDKMSIKLAKKISKNQNEWKQFLKYLFYEPVDLQEELHVERLAKRLNNIDKLQATHGNKTFYLSVSPNFYGSGCKALKKAGLLEDPAKSRVVIEKPFGRDYSSAKKLNRIVQSCADESQIYRIDHYLGKETVQNLMALRFANTFFENQWDNKNIENVQITVAEEIGVADRISYYNEYGAIRDMVQNHLLQLLCLVAMEPPSYFDANQVRDEKLRILKSLRSLSDSDIQTGQYQGYENEFGKPTNTETFIALQVGIDNWRWAGVPFYLRTGKKLSTRASEIIITFKNKPHNIFSKLKDFDKNNDKPNMLIIRVQPNEGLRLKLTSKEPGPGGMRFFPSELNLSFNETFVERLPDAYERLLMDVARGNQTLFMRLDEVLAAWDFIDPIVDKVQSNPPQLYRSGTMGPEDKILIINNHEWIDPKE